MTRRVVVVGGGISGLVAMREIRKNSPETEATLLESSPRLGGKILTTQFLGKPVDEGADAFINRVPWGLELCKELGLDNLLVSPNSSEAYVMTDNGLKRLPKGLVLGVPTRFLPLVRSRIVSPWAALRAGFDRYLPDDWPGEDESIGGLIRRRMGDQIAERLVDPLIGSINAGNTDHLDAAMVAPQLETAARRNRSLIMGLREHKQNDRNDDEPVFVGFREGMQQLTEGLVRSLAGSDIRTGVSVHAIELGQTGLRVLGDTKSTEADAVILTTPAHQAAEILQTSSQASERLSSIEHASVVLVTMGFKSSDVGNSLNGSGMLIPRNSGFLTTAVSWGSSKWRHWDDGEHVILRVSAGRAGDTRALALDDNELVEALLTEVAQILKIEGNLVEWRVSRWIDAFPQYAPGHDRLVTAIERDLRTAMPGIYIAGAGYKGLGIPACINQGKLAAKSALDYLGTL
tara:strand:- start:4095 stop:5474 length:1380 start_codon:yes stop_codon:yes gene_type:complete